MAFSTDQLRSLLNNENGVASNNRYAVFLPPISGTPKPGGGAATYNGTMQDLNYLCTSASIPGKTIATIDRNIGLEPVKVANGYDLPPVSLTFYLTGQYSARNYFQEWIECVISREPPFTAGFLSDYGKQVTIEQRDKQNKKIFGVKLEKSYPLSINEIQLNNQPQASVSELTVTLAYSHYTTF